MIVVWEGASICGVEDEDPSGSGGTSQHSRGHLPTSRAPLLLVLEYPISYISGIYQFCVYCVLILVQYVMISISRNFRDKK